MKFIWSILSVILIVILSAQESDCKPAFSIQLPPRPVVFMHGLLSDASRGDQLLTWIREDFPDVPIYSLKSFQGSKSLFDMATQVAVFNQEVKMFMYQIGANVILKF